MISKEHMKISPKYPCGVSTYNEIEGIKGEIIKVKIKLASSINKFSLKMKISSILLL